jgi:anti-anti-sigma regulatory factor
VSRFGVWIHPGGESTVEAWGELCMSTVPELRTCVLQVMEKGSDQPLILDLRRVWFCDLTGLRLLWWLVDRGISAGMQVEMRESESIARTGRLIDGLLAARTA